MNLLLDTHIFLWYITKDKRLPARYRMLIRDPTNAVFLSVVSLSEVLIKYQLGKLPLPHPPDAYLPAQRARHNIMSLSLDDQPSLRSLHCRLTTVIHSTVCLSARQFTDSSPF